MPDLHLRKEIENKRMKAKHHYDKQAHARPTFKEGDSKILKKEKHWVPAQRRNSSYLKPSPNPFILEKNAQAEYEDITNQSNNAHNSFGLITPITLLQPMMLIITTLLLLR
ncbi:hypothetical protein QE152_g13734 [Popillia japonica]|uniref:Uncharacterized protein n=1 Tax=Popillia japonica TaxID=7064 RepID=A0AAW1LC73_POPJA